MDAQKAVEQLGYTHNEAKVYLAALSLGESHSSHIAQKTQLSLSTVQTIASDLHRKGAINFYVRKRYKYWVAESPTHLLAKLKERENTFRAALPRLESLRHGDKQKPHTKIFEGVDEIRLIYDDMLETRDHIRAIIPWEDWIRLLGRGFMEDFVERRVHHHLRIKLIIPRSSVAEQIWAHDNEELRQTRYLPEDVPIKTTTLIYGEKVAIISLNKKLPTAVLIEDADVNETVSAFFEEMWERCAEPVQQR